MRLIDELPSLPPEWIQFFTVFQRFEYALKKHHKFLIHKDVDCAAMPNWQAFGNSLGQTFFDKIQRGKLADTLINRPPKKEIVVEGGTDFREEKPPTRSSELFTTVCRVRNNLFHGGKPNIDERSTTLIRESLVILNEALTDCEEVKVTFRGY